MSNLKEIVIPDIGGAKDVDVIELLVAPGDKVNVESPLITLEGDKATMEIPAPFAGIVREMRVKVGDKVSQGALILTLDVAESGAQDVKLAPNDKPAAVSESAATTTTATAPKSEPPLKIPATSSEPQPFSSTADLHAGPGVRRLARDFGVDLERVSPTGNKQRILKEDVQRFVKTALSTASATPSGVSFAASPAIDFSQFGDIEVKALNRIKKLTGANVHRSWVTVPHVTQFGEADITELEAFREQQKAAAEKKGVKLTPLIFIMKTVVAALKTFAHFNASLDASGENLVLKKYFHIGVAVDTPNGLVVPVIRDVDKKSLYQLAAELAQISNKAREKGLSITDMQGSCFTISSLGGIGGTAFTPIVNAPDVAILGVSKASIKPVYQNAVFVPRLMLPLALSYDHRVIDGAEGARFMVYLAERLADIRTLLL